MIQFLAITPTYYYTWWLRENSLDCMGEAEEAASEREAREEGREIVRATQSSSFGVPVVSVVGGVGMLCGEL